MPGDDPLTPLDFDPVEDPGELLRQPPRDADACGCSSGGKKKKKKKPKERDVCYRGTYVQLKKGISYRRLEQVACDAKAPKKEKAAAPRRRTPKSPKFEDLARDVFGF